MQWLRLVLGVVWLIALVVWGQLTFAVTLVAIGGLFIGVNAVVFWSTIVRKDHAPSVLPIFGGLIAAAGIVLLPITGSWKWAWIPLVIDWGGLPMYLAAAWFKELPR